MRTPRLLMGASLLFWGLQSGYLAVAAVMAIILESSHFIGVRWEFSNRDFSRLWNLSMVLLLGVIVYAFTSRQGPSAWRDFLQSPSSLSGQSAIMNQTARAIFVVVQCLPMVFFVFMAGQAFSQQPGVDLISISWIARWARLRAGDSGMPPRVINLAYPYFALCVIAACIGQPGVHRTFLGLCILVFWALWRERSHRYPLPAWLALIACAAVLSYQGNRGLERLHVFFQNYTPDWFSGRLLGGIDAKESRTALGSMGRFKLSGKIIFRIETKNNQPPPALLREASYAIYRSPIWYGTGTDKDFELILPEADETSWTLRNSRTNDTVATVAGYLPNGRGLLPLPNGVSRLRNLPAAVLESNRLGVIRMDAGPGFVMFDSHYGSGAGIDSPADADDQSVPERERTAVERIASDLNLGAQEPQRTIEILSAFFKQNFRYDLTLSPPPQHLTNQTPLSWFLLDRRAGHCEYFATAAVLLLRQAGIPARYAVGYAVQERSGRRFLVRERHAHAWCLVYYGGVWHDFDPTPPDWSKREAALASMFEWLGDIGSRFWFEFTKFRYGYSAMRNYLLWLFIPLLIVSLWRLFSGKQWKRLRQGATSPAIQFGYPGLDSELYELEKALVQEGVVRNPSENLSSWLRRCQALPIASSLGPSLETLLQLHYRYRFDPIGLNSSEREALRLQAETCLRQLTTCR